MSQAKPIPEGFHTVTPHLVVRGAAKAIEFYKKAFGAEEIMRMPSPEGKLIMHAEIKIGNSMIMLVDEMPQMDRCVSPQKLGGTTMGLSLYVEDADALYDRAIKAGGTDWVKPMDAFWGDRYSKLTDPFGHAWEICTRKEDLTPEEIGQRAERFFANMKQAWEQLIDPDGRIRTGPDQLVILPPIDTDDDGVPGDRDEPTEPGGEEGGDDRERPDKSKTGELVDFRQAIPPNAQMPGPSAPPKPIAQPKPMEFQLMQWSTYTAPMWVLLGGMAVSLIGMICVVLRFRLGPCVTDGGVRCLFGFQRLLPGLLRCDRLRRSIGRTDRFS